MLRRRATRVAPARVLVLVFVLVLGHVVSAASAAGVPEQRVLRASPLPRTAGWQGQQYVGTNGKGKVFLLRPEALQVVPLEADGELGKAQELISGGVGSPGMVLDAAMDRYGDWIFLHGSEVRWFRAGKERPVPPLDWNPIAVALVKGEPVVAVLPIPQGRLTRRQLASPPLLLALSGDHWTARVDSEIEGVPDFAGNATGLHQDFASRIYGAADGTLWLSNLYRYRLVHYSPAGRELLSLAVDEAKIHHREERAVEPQREALEAERARSSHPEKAKITTNSAIEAILDLVEGRDGRLYLLTRAGREGDALSLDRFEPARGVLERVPTTLSMAGVASIAAGREGLYVVPFNGRERRWFFSWESLEAADWREVEGVELNGPDRPRHRPKTAG